MENGRKLGEFIFAAATFRSYHLLPCMNQEHQTGKHILITQLRRPNDSFRMGVAYRNDHAMVRSLQLSEVRGHRDRGNNWKWPGEEVSTKIRELGGLEKFCGEHIHVLESWNTLTHRDRSSCSQNHSRSCPIYHFIWLSIWVLYHVLYY